MDEKMDARKLGMIAFAVIALIAAVGVIFWTVKSQEVQVIGEPAAGPGSSPKVQFMKAQKEGKGGNTPEKDPNAVGDKSQ